jgi:hypothetical protein
VHHGPVRSGHHLRRRWHLQSLPASRSHARPRAPVAETGGRADAPDGRSRQECRPRPGIRLRCRAERRGRQLIHRLPGAPLSAPRARRAFRQRSELAVENIQRIVEALEFDLETYVVDWAEFRDLQRAFLLASVIDFELPTDNAITATLLNAARQHGVKHVLMGSNIATEHGIPAAWVWLKLDWTNIKAIHKAYGSVPLKTFPHVGTIEWGVVRVLGIGLNVVRPLNLIDYRRKVAVDVLASELGWREYGGKHHESLITKFFQGYILPTKFGVDKRRAHLSDQIRSGEITRDAALAEVAEPAYPPEELARERDYVLKKLGFSEEEFDQIMATPPRSHLDFASDQWWAGGLRSLVRPIRRL